MRQIHDECDSFFKKRSQVKNVQKIIFIHGLESSGSGFKGNFLRNEFPGILTPDFKGDLEKRMQQLTEILRGPESLIIIGSSWGGLMATLYTFSHQERVSLLLLLAPVLVHPKLNSTKKAIDVPVIIYHGKNDEIVPLEASKKRAMQLFNNLEYNEVNDDHLLHSTVKEINWHKIITSFHKE